MTKNCLLLPLLLCSLSLYSQPERVTGGLSFSSGLDFNGLETGTPGFFGKVHLKFIEKVYVVPSLTVFYPKERDNQILRIRNYMFQADLDFQHVLVYNKDLLLSGFAGINGTSIISKVTELEPGGARGRDDDSHFKPGINVGACLDMFVNDSFNGSISAKYLLGGWKQFILQAGVSYYFNGTHRKSW